MKLLPTINQKQPASSTEKRQKTRKETIRLQRREERYARNDERRRKKQEKHTPKMKLGLETNRIEELACEQNQC